MQKHENIVPRQQDTKQFKYHTIKSRIKKMQILYNKQQDTKNISSI